MLDIRNVDCMTMIREYPDKHFELAIVDVPYGIGEDGSKNHTRDNKAIAKKYKSFYGEDIKSPDVEYFIELFRVSKNQIIWGANHFISKIPYDSSCWIVWDKNNTGDFADCELAWTSFKTAVRKFKYTWNGMLQEDMANKEKRIHPTQKPVALYEWLLTKYAKKGDKILDTHGGSMSIAIACHNLGFDLTAAELDKDYYDAAMKRITFHQAQKRMF